MPISPTQKAWLERFCKANRYQFDFKETSASGIVIYKKPIGNNMVATIAYGEGSLSTSFLLVANHVPFRGNQTIPWPLIGGCVNDLKLQLFAGMSAAWDEVFNKVTGCGLEELKKIE